MLCFRQTHTHAPAASAGAVFVFVLVLGEYNANAMNRTAKVGRPHAFVTCECAEIESERASKVRGSHGSQVTYCLINRNIVQNIWINMPLIQTATPQIYTTMLWLAIML